MRIDFFFQFFYFFVESSGFSILKKIKFYFKDINHSALLATHRLEFWSTIRISRVSCTGPFLFFFWQQDEETQVQSSSYVLHKATERSPDADRMVIPAINVQREHWQQHMQVTPPACKSASSQDVKRGTLLAQTSIPASTDTAATHTSKLFQK